MTENSYGTDHESRITNHESRIKIGGQGCSALLSPYTLLEIMMVVSIMALLMAITMPAFNDMMKGQGVESAARNICQRLKLARSYAISNREYVAVLFPDSTMPDKYDRQSMRACLVNGSDMSFKRWIPGENWSFLPTGTAIWEIDATSDGYDTGTFAASDVETVSAVKTADYGNKSIPAIVFKPNGTTLKKASILLGEGTYSGGALVKTNSDTSTGVNITINPFTGRVSYGKD